MFFASSSSRRSTIVTSSAAGIRQPGEETLSSLAHEKADAELVFGDP